MSTKIRPGPYDCYADALPDEPMFILLARDQTAPDRIRDWADIKRKQLIADYGALPESDPKSPRAVEFRDEMAKCQNADEIAHDMATWRALHDGAWRNPASRAEPVMSPDLRDAIHDEVRRCVASLSVAGLAQISIVEHRYKPWSMPGFAIWRHYFRIESNGLFGRFTDLETLELPDFNLSGYDSILGDVFLKCKSDSDIRVEIQIVRQG